MSQKKSYSWQTRNLGDIAYVGAGNSAPQGEAFFINGKYPFIRTSDVGRYRITRSLTDVSDYLNEKGVEGLRFYKSGTILIPKSWASTFLNHRAIMGIDWYVSSHLATIGTKEELVSPEFVFYFLQTIKAQDLIQDHSYPSLSLSAIEGIPLPLPPLPEQLRIVSILDETFQKLDQAKENFEKNLQNAKDVFESYLQSIFENPKEDWEEKALEDVCEIQSKLIDPREPEFLDMVHVGAGNIEMKTGRLIDLKTAREEKLISGKFRFDESMVLYSKIRPYLMKVVRPAFKGLCSADIYPLVPQKNLITWDYLYWLLLTPMFTDFAIKGSARAGMPKVNREHLFAFKLFLPPLPEQLSIVSQLDTLSASTKRLEFIYQQKLACLDELRKSLLKKAFSGEL